jgi:hypothetical protein
MESASYRPYEDQERGAMSAIGVWTPLDSRPFFIVQGQHKSFSMSIASWNVFMLVSWGPYGVPYVFEPRDTFCCRRTEAYLYGQAVVGKFLAVHIACCAAELDSHGNINTCKKI